MNEIDREVIALRHFEELTSAETAEVLGIEKSAASNAMCARLRGSRRFLQSVPAWRACEFFEVVPSQPDIDRAGKAGSNL